MTPAARYRAACHALGLPVWRPGMRAVAARPAPLEPVCSRAPDDLRGWTPYAGAEPDFTDPATVGCLLAAVREAWNCHAIHTQGRLHQLGEEWWYDKSQRQPTWRWSTVIPGWPNTSGPTEADALIAALEAAARRGGQP
jgi:hypothetical protein